MSVDKSGVMHRGGAGVICRFLQRACKENSGAGLAISQELESFDRQHSKMYIQGIIYHNAGKKRGATL
jgi:hypothetical protein